MARPNLMEMLARASRDDDEHEEPRISIDIEAVKLVDALRSFQIRHTFKVGDLVQQKRGASVYRRFGDNDLAIVVGLLAEPIIHEGEIGTPYFHQVFDMMIGSIEGKDFPVFHVDSQRFEPATDPAVRRLLSAAAA